MNQVALNKINNTDFECIEAWVKWYDPIKGYGFLVRNDGSEDIFMHFSILDAAGFQDVDEGDRIVCEIGSGKDGPQVLRVLEVEFVSRGLPSRGSPYSLSSNLPFFDSAN